MGSRTWSRGQSPGSGIDVHFGFIELRSLFQTRNWKGKSTKWSTCTTMLRNFAGPRSGPMLYVLYLEVCQSADKNTLQSYISYCDPVYKDLRNRLFKDYKFYKTEHDPNVPEMEDDVCLSITNHLSVLFKALANAEVSRQQAGISEATESAMRSAWDDILKATCCSPEETLSKPFLFVFFIVFNHLSLN
jgi:hypothetical protein